MADGRCRRWTDEEKKAMSEKKLKVISEHPEYRQKMSIAQKKRYEDGWKHPRLWKTFSAESRLKMSLSHIGQEVSDETRQKLSEMRQGDKHWNYKKDRSQLAKRQERNDTAYKEWRMNVWKRDKFCCCMSSDECKWKIEAHHILKWIEYPELRYEVSNGLTLCHFHHPKKVKEEKRLIPYFQELVSVSKDN
jgi:hypothetical protein